MGRRHTWFAVIFGATILLNSSRADSPEDIAPVLEPIRLKFNAPAVAAGIVRDGQLAGVGVSGVRSLDGKEPAAVTDRSLIGSCGKAATRLLIGRLVDQKLIRWDSTLAELLPDVPMQNAYKDVAVGDIIAHRGGLQPYTMINPTKTPAVFIQAMSAREARAEFTKHLLMEPPVAQPKTRFVYSNAGYGLLGHLAERIANKPFEQLMRDEVFRSLGMKSAIVGNPGAASNIAGWGGHLRENDSFKPAIVRPSLPPIAPAGLMSMSIEDFAKLASALIEVEAGRPNEFLGPMAIEKLPELRPGSAGEGEIFFGGDGHYTAAFALWPSRNLAIVVMSNAGDSDDVCAAIINTLRERFAPQISGERTGQGKDPPRPRYGLRLEMNEDDSGLLIAGIDPDSPAQRAGLKAGDKILAINGSPLDTLSETEQLSAFRESPLRLRVSRGGATQEITLELK